MAIEWRIEGAPLESFMFCLAPGDEKEAAIEARLLHGGHLSSSRPHSKPLIDAIVASGEVCGDLIFRPDYACTILMIAISADRDSTAPIMNAVKKDGVVAPAYNHGEIINADGQNSDGSPKFKPLNEVMTAPAVGVGVRPEIMPIIVRMV